MRDSGEGTHNVRHTKRRTFKQGFHAHLVYVTVIDVKIEVPIRNSHQQRIDYLIVPFKAPT